MRLTRAALVAAVIMLAAPGGAQAKRASVV